VADRTVILMAGPRQARYWAIRGDIEATRRHVRQTSCPGHFAVVTLRLEIDFGPEAVVFTNGLDERSPVWYLATEDSAEANRTLGTDWEPFVAEALQAGGGPCDDGGDPEGGAGGGADVIASRGGRQAVPGRGLSTDLSNPAAERDEDARVDRGAALACRGRWIHHVVAAHVRHGGGRRIGEQGVGGGRPSVSRRCRLVPAPANATPHGEHGSPQPPNRMM
jgi:hypothetical protein